MGCDIHCYIEFQMPENNRWRSFCDRISLGRNYALFGRLAGVRGGTPLVAPRGWPDDAGYGASEDNFFWISEDKHFGKDVVSDRQAAQYVASGKAFYDPKNTTDYKRVSNPDFHTHSWLNTDEWLAAVVDFEEIECDAMVSAMRVLERDGGVARVVFWFDD